MTVSGGSLLDASSVADEKVWLISCVLCVGLTAVVDGSILLIVSSVLLASSGGSLLDASSVADDKVWLISCVLCVGLTAVVDG